MQTFINNDIPENVVIETKVIKNLFNEKDSANGFTKKQRNPLKIDRIPQVIINVIKTAKINEKNITTLNPFKIKPHHEINQRNTVIYFQKNHSPLKQTTTIPLNQINSLVANCNNFQKNQTLVNTTQNLPFGKSDAIDITRVSIEALDENQQSELSLITSNELEQIIKNKSKSKKEVMVLNYNKKWHITPHIATVNLNPNSGGSAITPQFSENQKTAENSLNLGIGKQYAVSKTVALRSGINRLSIGYNTNDVVYRRGLVNNNLDNIEYSSETLIEIKNVASLFSLTTFKKDLQKPNTGAIIQKISYYEIPLEVS